MYIRPKTKSLLALFLISFSIIIAIERWHGKIITPNIINSLFNFERPILNNEYKPIISVIIPCHEKGEFLEKAFKSCVEDQHLTKYRFNIEIICVDDGSTDNTFEIFHKLKKKYESINIETNQPFPKNDHNPFKNNIHIKIFKNNENKGSLYSKQFAIKQASGEYIMSLDADDELIPDIMHRLLLLLNNREDIDIIQFRLAVVNNTIEQEFLNENNPTRTNYTYSIFTYAKYPFEMKKSLKLTMPIEKAKYSLCEKYISESGTNDIDKNKHAIFLGATKMKKLSRRYYMMWNLPGLIMKRKIVVMGIDALNFNYSSLKISIFEDMLLSYASYYFSKKIYFLDEVGYIYFKGIKKFKRENHGRVVLRLLRRLYRSHKK